MTTCAHGASVKAGVSPTQQILVDRWLWEQVTGVPSSWFDWVLDIVEPSTISASALCALNLDDPALPTLITLASAFTGDPQSVTAVVNYVRQKLEYAAFVNACVCNGGSPGTCLGAEFADSGYTDFSDTSTNDEVCNRITLTAPADMDGIWIHGGSGSGFHAATLELFDAVTHTSLGTWTTAFVSAGTHVFLSTGTIHLAAQNYYLCIRRPINVTYPAVNNGSLNVTYNPFGHINSADSAFTNGTGFPTTALTVLWGIEPDLCPSTAPTTPPPPVQPPQPTDLQLPPSWSCTTIGDLCTRLQQIEQRILSIGTMVTLIQRQHVPFAYLTQPSLPVSGSGSATVSGILGVALALSDSRTGITNFPDNPNTIVDLGWLTFATADGNYLPTPIRRLSQLILDLSPAITSIRWSLPSGVSGTLTPLVREP